MKLGHLLKSPEILFFLFFLVLLVLLVLLVFLVFVISVRIFRTVLVESPEILLFSIVWLSVGLESLEILLLLGF